MNFPCIDFYTQIFNHTTKIILLSLAQKYLGSKGAQMKLNYQVSPGYNLPSTGMEFRSSSLFVIGCNKCQNNLAAVEPESAEIKWTVRFRRQPRAILHVNAEALLCSKNPIVARPDQLPRLILWRMCRYCFINVSGKFAPHTASKHCPFREPELELTNLCT